MPDFLRLAWHGIRQRPIKKPIKSGLHRFVWRQYQHRFSLGSVLIYQNLCPSRSLCGAAGQCEGPLRENLGTWYIRAVFTDTGVTVLYSLVRMVASVVHIRFETVLDPLTNLSFRQTCPRLQVPCNVNIIRN